MRPWSRAAWMTAGLLVGAGTLTGCGGDSHAAIRTTGGGPTRAYDCSFNVGTTAWTGAYGTASEIGWEGNHQGVVTCLGGTFHVQNGIDRNFGFGIYTGTPTTWTDAGGYLPAQVTTFPHSGAIVSITEFADKLVLGDNAYVAVYSRVAVRNSTDHVVTANPTASSGLVPLNADPNSVKAHASVTHDYVVAVDRFGNNYPWPSAQALATAGSFDQHYAHMRNFWNQQLAGIAGIAVPDSSLDDAYRSGFIYTQIARSGDALNTGVNGYESEFDHDVVGILANLFTQGYFSDSHALLLEARNVVGTQSEYLDGVWTYAWPWAIYLMKTGDLAFVKKNFATKGPGFEQPSIKDTAHQIASDRTGPSGIMGSTYDIDTVGYWTTDDYEALLGLAAYRYLAQRVGDFPEVTWATQQYDSLLSATNETLDATISRNGLDYLPCSILEPNTANRCANPEDSNWTSPFGFGGWAWNGSLFGGTLNGPGTSLIDSTYAYGFQRLKGRLPPDTFGGFPGDYYSTGYNAGMGSAGLASTGYRDQGILSYEFMIENSQSGPYSWWESSSAPSAQTPWIGRHPAAGQGSSPHAWGISQANKVLLDSLVAQRSDGTLVVGRGIPAQWLGHGASISVTNFPTTNGGRLSIRISSTVQSVSLSMSGGLPPGQVLFQLPSFANNIAAASSGIINQETGTVTLAPHTKGVTVQFRGALVP